MTLLFSLLIIICGVSSAWCFADGAILMGLVPAAITILSIIALIGRIKWEKKTLGGKANPPATQSETDKIREYKKLMDEGVISKEEFEKKKNQLMNQ